MSPVKSEWRGRSLHVRPARGRASRSAARGRASARHRCARRPSGTRSRCPRCHGRARALSRGRPPARSARAPARMSSSGKYEAAELRRSPVRRGTTAPGSSRRAAELEALAGRPVGERPLDDRCALEHRADVARRPRSGDGLQERQPGSRRRREPRRASRRSLSPRRCVHSPVGVPPASRSSSALSVQASRQRSFAGPRVHRVRGEHRSGRPHDELVRRRCARSRGRA